MSQAERKAARSWGKPIGREPTEEDRTAIVERLRDLAQAVENQELEAQPYAIGIVLLGQRAAVVHWSPAIVRDEAHLIESAFRERFWSVAYDRPARNVVEEAIARNYDRAQELRAYREGRPHVCEFCRGERRFATERGLAMHQARNRFCLESQRRDKTA